MAQDYCSFTQVLIYLQEHPCEPFNGQNLQTAICACTSSQEQAFVAQKAFPFFKGNWEAVCLRLIWQLAEEISHSHAHNLPHPAAEPQNILLAPRGDVRLHKFADDSAKRKTLCNHQNDLASLGKLLQELLLLNSKNGKIDPVYAEVFQRALHPEQKNSFETIHQFMQAIGNALQDKSAETLEPLPSKTKRRWRLSVGHVFLLITLIGIGLLINNPPVFLFQLTNAATPAKKQLSEKQAIKLCKAALPLLNSSDLNEALRGIEGMQIVAQSHWQLLQKAEVGKAISKYLISSSAASLITPGRPVQFHNQQEAQEALELARRKIALALWAIEKSAR